MEPKFCLTLKDQFYNYDRKNLQGWMLKIMNDNDLISGYIA
jgi:hypothetical protein